MQAIKDLTTGKTYRSFRVASEDLAPDKQANSLYNIWMALWSPPRWSAWGHRFKLIDRSEVGLEEVLPERPVYNLTTGRRYSGLREASKATGVSVSEINESIFFKEPRRGQLWSRHPERR